MLPNSNGHTSFNRNISTGLRPLISYVDFNQDDGSYVNDYINHGYPLASSISIQRIDQKQTEQPLPTPRLTNSSLATLSYSSLKDSTTTFAKEKDGTKSLLVPIKDNTKQSKPYPILPLSLITSDRAQQTSPSEMFPINYHNTNNNNHDSRYQSSVSEDRQSQNSTAKQSNSDEHTSTLAIDDETELSHEIKSTAAANRPKQIPKIKYTNKNPTSVTKTGKSPILKWSSSLNTPRILDVVPSITHRAFQGVLIEFFRIGDIYHRGVKMAVNDFEFKSWEAFLNYLNRQPRLALSTGGIKHIYSLTGEEIYSIRQFQHHQSYVVSSGAFIRTNYRWINNTFVDESHTSIQPDTPPYWNTRSSVHSRWRSPPPPPSLSAAAVNGEQIFFLPYSKLNMYESLILNRNLTQTFDEWLKDQVTDLLSHYTNNENITNLFAVTKLDFIEVKSFSKLFNMMRTTDTFVACTEDEYVHAKDYLEIMKPSELFMDRKSSRRTNNGNHQQDLPKRVMEDAKPLISWIHGYDGENELTKTLYTLPENEILYVIDSVCILYETNLKQQRFYTKHKDAITCVNVHQSQSIVASSEIGSSKTNQQASVHIWDHVKLETIAEIRKEQFGSFISLLSLSPKSDDHLLLIISRDKPKIVLFVDWERNELIYTITCKSDNILSVLFVFDTTEWIACISQRYLLFYHVNWSLRPLRMLERRESEVQNIYTGAAACDIAGERLLVGDEVGNIYVWCLIDNEPKLVVVQECILENNIEIIVPIDQETFLLANGQNQIKIWNIKLDTIEQIRLNETIGSIQSVCGIQQRSLTTALAIGTKSNYIIKKPIGKEQFDIIMRGHTSPSICICCERNSHYFFSISSDRYLFKWNNTTRSVEWSTKSTQPISCADLHPQRNIIVLGTETSKLILYDTLSSFYIATITLKFNTGVKSVRFSPDGSNLAVGLQNGHVCIFDVLGNGDFHLRTDGILQNDSAPVSHVIWSIDSKYLLAVYTDNDYNIWAIPSFEIHRGKKIENINWDRVVHPIMCNILDKSIIEAHISAIILSPNLVLCCGKDGQLRLFRNRYENNSQTFQLGLGSTHSIIPSTTNKTYLLSMTNNPVIVEIQVDVNTYIS